jgi:2-dehydropantoate 2-reductase
VRIIVYGAGAVGGVVGGRLAENGHQVILIARGPHLDAMATRGLRVESPEGSTIVRPPVVGSPADIEWRPDDVVLLAVKSQDTAVALRRMAASAPDSVAVACLQNGVANERQALRLFPHVYGICVMCPASHLEPGVVVAHSTPIAALLDVGRYPGGVDHVALSVAEAINASAMESIPRTDVMRWKYRKLIMNLANAIDAACGPAERDGRLGQMVREEGERVLRAAGIPYISAEEDRERRGDRLRLRRADGVSWSGSSSWQSLARASGTIEADYLNGEIVLMGRLHGIPTPVNETLRRVVNRMAAEHARPGSVPVAEIMALIDSPAVS